MVVADIPKHSLEHFYHSLPDQLHALLVPKRENGAELKDVNKGRVVIRLRRPLPRVGRGRWAGPVLGLDGNDDARSAIVRDLVKKRINKRLEAVTREVTSGSVSSEY